MSGIDTEISIKEYFEKLYDSKLDALALALRLQAVEYDRRLELLNKSHERADAFSARVLTVEQYNPKHEVLITRIAALETSDIERRTRETTTRETLAVLKTVVVALTLTTILSVAGVLWEILTHGIALVKP
jgi:hypothetical protein